MRIISHRMNGTWHIHCVWHIHLARPIPPALPNCMADASVYGVSPLPTKALLHTRHLPHTLRRRLRPRLLGQPHIRPKPAHLITLAVHSPLRRVRRRRRRRRPPLLRSSKHNPPARQLDQLQPLGTLLPHQICPERAAFPRRAGVFTTTRRAPRVRPQQHDADRRQHLRDDVDGDLAL